MTQFLWHDGQWVEADQPLFKAQDRLRLGDGVFDTLLVVNGQPLYAAQHFTRLQRHAAVLGLPLTLTPQELTTTAQELIERNQASQGRYALNTLLSRGVGQRGLMPAQEVAPSLVMMLSPAPAPEDFPPVHAIIAQSVFRNEGSPLSRIKSCNYGDNILALQEAKKRGANEAIMLNNTRRVACTSAGNLLFALGGRLYTPPLSDGALDGIQRSVLIQQGALHEKSLLPDALFSAEALFLVNSIRGLMPIASLDGKALPQKHASDFL